MDSNPYKEAWDKKYERYSSFRKNLETLIGLEFNEDGNGNIVSKQPTNPDSTCLIEHLYHLTELKVRLIRRVKVLDGGDREYEDFYCIKEDDIRPKPYYNHRTKQTEYHDIKLSIASLASGESERIQRLHEAKQVLEEKTGVTFRFNSTNQLLISNLSYSDSPEYREKERKMNLVTLGDNFPHSRGVARSVKYHVGQQFQEAIYDVDLKQLRALDTRAKPPTHGALINPPDVTGKSTENKQQELG